MCTIDGMPESITVVISFLLLLFFVVMAAKLWYYEVRPPAFRFTFPPLFLGVVGCVGVCINPWWDGEDYWFVPFLLDPFSAWFLIRLLKDRFVKS